MSRERNLSLEEALERVRRIAPSPPAEEVPVPSAAGRTLAEDVRAERDLPPAVTSAMDGWAVRAADTPGALAAAGESVAGQPSDRALQPGQAMEISTGAILPEGADAVARREVVSVEGSTVRLEAAVAPGRDVRRRGEVIRAGMVLHPAGHRVAPHEVGGLGAVGRAGVLCARRIRVAILSSGEELVPLGAPAGPAQVHDSSRHGLAAQAEAAGAVVTASIAVGDDLDRTAELVAALLGAGGGERPDVLDHQRRHRPRAPRSRARRARAARGGGGRSGGPRLHHPPDGDRGPRGPGGAGAPGEPGRGRGGPARAGAAGAGRPRGLVAPRAADG